MSAGRRGASVNIGPRGTYVTTGIPGSGISSRKKIGGKPQRGPERAKEQIIVNLTVTLDEFGKPIIKDANGDIISDGNTLKKIKRQENYKEVVRNLVISRKEELGKANSAFLEIYKLTPSLQEIKSIESRSNDIKFQEYIKATFPEEEPSLEKIKAEFEPKQKSTVEKIFFWRKDSKNDIDFDKIYHEKLNTWKLNKMAFEEKESEKKEREDAQNKKLYENARKDLERELSNPEETITKRINEFLADLVLPVEFSIEFEYLKDNKSLYVDLDLPEIEDLPKKKAMVSASGKISIKPKTNKELKEDYSKCVIGLAFFFAGNFFNMTRDLENITISGYTQRLSKKTGNIEDEYVYSIKFVRNSFGKLHIKSIDPRQAIDNFENIINITSTYELKKIEPMSVKELGT